MLTVSPVAYARLPTYTEVIDGLAAGLGVAINKEDALGSLNAFGSRINVYSGSPHRSGLESRILDLLTGSKEKIRFKKHVANLTACPPCTRKYKADTRPAACTNDARKNPYSRPRPTPTQIAKRAKAKHRNLVQQRLLEAETTLTNARIFPLITEATEAEGLRWFILILAAQWVAQLLAEASQHPDSVLGTICLLIEAHAAELSNGDKSFLSTWKAAIKQAIPVGVDAKDFRVTIDKLDQRSQPKPSTIDMYITDLSNDKCGNPPNAEIVASVERVRRILLAGMVTMRFCTMAANIISENKLLRQVAFNLREFLDKTGGNSDQAQDRRIGRYRRNLDTASKLSNEFHRLSDPRLLLDPQRCERLRAEFLTSDHGDLLIPAIDFSEGYWRLCQGNNDLAKPCLERVVECAKYRQLGEIASYAASYLIALRLMEQPPPKFESLYPLLRVRIDNMEQIVEMIHVTTPTPFSNCSFLLEHRFYDRHLIQCVASFNDLPFRSEEFPLCNPLLRFDADLANLIDRSRQPGANLAEKKRSSPAIAGTSIKPYQMLRDCSYFLDALFVSRLPILPSLEAYLKLSEADQRRLLRFIDPEAFKKDLNDHKLDSWRHPDDPP